MSNGHFPLELISLIVRDAARNVKTLCLLHSTWVPLIRPLIFDILVADGQCDILAWQDLFTSAPDIPNHVRHVTLAPEGMTPGDPVVVEEFLHSFHKVLSLALLSFELDYNILALSPLRTVRSLILHNCLLDNVLPDLKYAFPHLTVLHIVDFVAGNLRSHVAAEQAESFLPGIMAFLFVETRSTETIDMCVDVMARDQWFQGVRDVEIQGSKMVLNHFCARMPHFGSRLDSLLLFHINYMLPAPILHNLSYATSLACLYVDGLQSGTGNLRETILGLPHLPFLQQLKVIYGADIPSNDLSLEHWNDVMCFLKHDRFPVLRSLVITVYWSHRRAKPNAKAFWDRVPESFPAYNKDLKTTVSVICDHPFRSLGSLTRAYHLVYDAP
ncbi:hypothetical protein ARMSODRAFT_1021370 [Armillaria solidipes]|uniref:F-box domain-containing protein n=1 Tax=Armillaria solidipes TaxID=1076256 RepID=A0A2H3BRT7_9AGAR|nr:hypothetical protein ARMSODRAFT_1021370 [Armillaria solidipes]